MSDNKKYYYLKLKENHFESDEMIVLESMPDGYKYSNILLKLYLRSLKNEGRLMFNNRIPFNSTMLASVTRHSVGDIERAIQIFKDLELVDILDNGAIYINEIQNFIGHGSSEAERKAIYREKISEEKKALGHCPTECPDKRPPELELEKNIEKETHTEQDEDEFEEFLNFISKDANKKSAYKAKIRKLFEKKDKDILIDLSNWQQQKIEISKQESELDFLRSIKGKLIKTNLGAQVIHSVERLNNTYCFYFDTGNVEIPFDKISFVEFEEGAL